MPLIGTEAQISIQPKIDLTDKIIVYDGEVAPTLSYEVVSYDIKTLSSDMVKLGADKESADKIQEYFETGRIKGGESFVNYRDEWLTYINKALAEQDVKFGPVLSKEYLIKKLNYLIGEKAKSIK